MNETKGIFPKVNRIETNSNLLKSPSAVKSHPYYRNSRNKKQNLMTFENYNVMIPPATKQSNISMVSLTSRINPKLN